MPLKMAVMVTSRLYILYYWALTCLWTIAFIIDLLLFQMNRKFQPMTRIHLRRGAGEGGVSRKAELEVCRADSQMTLDPPRHKAMMIQRAPHM